MRITFSIPMRIVSVPNQREHWFKKSKRGSDHRSVMRMMCFAKFAAEGRPKPPIRVLLTRVGPRTLDRDNLAASFKAAQDGVADALGIDDGDTKRLRFEYEQHKGGAGFYEVHVMIEGA